jgi:hypothetical protein
VKSRTDISGHKAVFAQDAQSIKDFYESVVLVKPTVIIGKLQMYSKLCCFCF